MKSSQFQKYSKKLLPFAMLCGLILLFTYGFSLTAHDLTFAAGLGEGGPSSWLTAAGNSGGNYLSAFLGAMCVDVPVLRHILIAAMLSMVVITLISYCGAEHSYAYYCALLLCLVPGAGIFSHAFGSVLGGVTVLIPAFLTILYLFTVSDLFIYKGRKKAWKIPFLFLSGLAAQLFTESLGVGILVLSLLLLILLTRKHGFSYHLGAHSFGSMLGFALSLLLKGGTDRFVHSFYLMVDQFTVALDQLFVENLLLIGLLTLACLLLVQPIRTERSKNCNKTLLLLLVPTVLFVLLNIIGGALKAFPVIYRYLTTLKLIASAAYCYGILRTIEHYVSKDRVILRVRHSLLALAVFVVTYSFCGTAQPHLLYLPHLCLVAVTVLIYLYAFHRYSRLDKVIRKPLMLAAIAGILALSFITAANGDYCAAVDTHIRESLAQGAGEITLPRAPYEKRILRATDSQLSDYYDLPSYGTVEITYVPFEQWDWNTYYEAHNVPVIEEYDEDAQETEDWAYELEEE